MPVPTLQDVFELKCLISNIDIKFSARVESGVKQLLALVTIDGNIVLHYTYGGLAPVVKKVPWFTETSKTIQAICFDTTSTWLLVVTFDNSLYILPVLSLVDKKEKIDCKWSINDLTHFLKHQNTPESKPQCVVWWQTLDCNQNALVGYENGSIALVSLTDGRCLGVCAITESVMQLNLCQDKSLESTFLLINGESGQQWRLTLEHPGNGYMWPPDVLNAVEDSPKSKLNSLKQYGMEKLVSLKQRMVESKHTRRNSQTSDTASDSSHSESTYSVPELMPHLCDTYFSAQYAKNRYLFCAFYKPSSLLTVHAADVETAPLYVYKLPPQTDYLLLTDRLIYIISNNKNSFAIISSYLAECRLEGDSEFNEESLVASFTLARSEEKILNIFKVTDTTIVNQNCKESKNNKTYSLIKTVDDSKIPTLKIDTCVIVTNYSVYKIIVGYSPIKKFISLITEELNIIKAQRVSMVFELNFKQLLEICGDLLLSNGSYRQGLLLYRQAKVHLLKQVLKMAVSADCKALLMFINLCLRTSKVDMSIATKIHIGNLAVMAHTEMVLRHPGLVRVTNTRDFMTFLCFEEYYDQVLAVNVACQAGLWNVVVLLAKCRGLQPEVVAALSQVLQSNHIRESIGDFLISLSEPSLTQSLLIYPTYSLPILSYIRKNASEFSVDILKRFSLQLDPSQPSALPIISRIFQQKNETSGIESTADSSDNETCCSTLIKEFIETYILVLLNLVDKTADKKFDVSFLEKVCYPEVVNKEETLKKFPPLHLLSCGYEHAGVVRNNHAYTMGMASRGCLGHGPVLTQSSPPKLVQTLADLGTKVLSLSCGRKHTLALTDNGVYSWGSNSYGQLGLGDITQESPYPQMISTLYGKNIIDVNVGQYHSMALSARGKVYTWGWGIHGQLGHGTCNNETFPKLLDFSIPIIQIAAGHAHSLILSVEGKIYGFGSNCFGQLGSCNVDGGKTTKPVWVLLLPDIYTPVEKISTAYFHNVAVKVDQEVVSWGASPQEVHFSKSKHNQKLNGFDCKIQEPWKTTISIFSGKQKKSIGAISAGYRQTALLHNGTLLWGRCRYSDIEEPAVDDYANDKKFVDVCCGPDYIIASEHNGRILAWGNNSVAQTLLERPYEEHRQADGKVILLRNTKRLIKIPANAEILPIEVPGLPSLEINYNAPDQRSILRKNLAHQILLLENNGENTRFKSLNKTNFDLSFISHVPSIILGHKSLHFVLETYFGIYDSEVILNASIKLKNYQAASKVSMLEGHFGDSLNYQLKGFKAYIDLYSICIDVHPKADDYDINSLGDLYSKNDKTDLNGIKFEFNSLNSPAHILSTSSSLDSIRQWGDDLDHQGGCESPCEVSEIGDVKHSMSQYVHSIKIDNTNNISSVSKLLDKPKTTYNGNIEYEIENIIKDSKGKEVIKTAAYLIEFFIQKTHFSENHILMQNILLQCIEFWLNNSLPVSVLELVLLKNMDKYFYPLSILLFCKNFNNNLGENYIQNNGIPPTTSARFLKEFSTKFCLQLCSMVLENVNKN